MNGWTEVTRIRFKDGAPASKIHINVATMVSMERLKRTEYNIDDEPITYGYTRLVFVNAQFVVGHGVMPNMEVAELPADILRQADG
jgi:hypothetical protein